MNREPSPPLGDTTREPRAGNQAGRAVAAIRNRDSKRVLRLALMRVLVMVVFAAPEGRRLRRRDQSGSWSRWLRHSRSPLTARA